jgi:hypothetical protein
VAVCQSRFSVGKLFRINEMARIWRILRGIDASKPLEISGLADRDRVEGVAGTFSVRPGLEE